MSRRSFEADHDALLHSMAETPLNAEDVLALNTIQFRAPDQCDQDCQAHLARMTKTKSTLYQRCWHLTLYLWTLQTGFCLVVLITWITTVIHRATVPCTSAMLPEPPKLSFCAEVDFHSEHAIYLHAQPADEVVTKQLLHSVRACFSPQMSSPAGVVRQLDTLKHIWLHDLPLYSDSESKFAADAQSSSQLTMWQVLGLDSPTAFALQDAARRENFDAAESMRAFAVCIEEALTQGRLTYDDLLFRKQKERDALVMGDNWKSLKALSNRNGDSPKKRDLALTECKALDGTLSTYELDLRNLTRRLMGCMANLETFRMAVSTTPTNNSIQQAVLRHFVSMWRTDSEELSSQLENYYFVQLPRYLTHCEKEPWLVHVAKHGRHHGAAYLVWLYDLFWIYILALYGKM